MTIKEKITALDASLNFFKNRDDIDSVVFGIESVSQLNEIYKSWVKKKSYTSDFSSLNFSCNFLDPRKWHTKF